MSELDEYGIIRYILDTGDRIISIVINDIAEYVPECSDTNSILMKIKKKYIPFYDEMLPDTLTIQESAEYIIIKGLKFYVFTWRGHDDYIIFQIDKYITKHGKILFLDTSDKNIKYDVDWLLHNKCLYGNDGGFIKRNYRMFSKCFINDYGIKSLFYIDHSKIDSFYGFEKYLVNTFYSKTSNSQEKHGV